MKKKYLLLCTFIIVFSLVGCGKKEVNTDALNEGVNQLLGDLPMEEITIKEEETSIKYTDMELEEYIEEQLENDVYEESEIEAALEFSEELMNVVEDFMPEDLDFSFYDATTNANVPESLEFLNLEWMTTLADYASVSTGVGSPALSLTGGIDWYNDTEKLEAEVEYQTLRQDILSQFGKIVAGDNYEIFKIDELIDVGMSTMIFEYTDSFVLVSSEYQEIKNYKNENDETLKMIKVDIVYLSKESYHAYDGTTYDICQYIQSKVPGSKFKYLYKNEMGTFTTGDKEVEKTNPLSRY